MTVTQFINRYSFKHIIPSCLSHITWCLYRNNIVLYIAILMTIFKKTLPRITYQVIDIIFALNMSI